MKRFLLADPSSLTEAERDELSCALAKSKALATIYAMRHELSSLWERSTESSEQLSRVACRTGAAAPRRPGFAPLAAFSYKLRRYA
jgi:stearoyl-CoA desaturase (delta-9 desaturase)